MNQYLNVKSKGLNLLGETIISGQKKTKKIKKKHKEKGCYVFDYIK